MKKSISDYRKESVLNKKLNYNGFGVMTRREWLDLLRVKGAKVEESTKSKVQYNRIKFNRMDGEQQKEYEKKLNEKVPCYRLYEKEGDTSAWEITKTEYDYFLNAQLSEDILTEKYDLSERIEAGLATEEEIQEDMDKEIAFMNKYFTP